MLRPVIVDSRSVPSNVIVMPSPDDAVRIVAQSSTVSIVIARNGAITIRLTKLSRGTKNRVPQLPHRTLWHIFIAATQRLQNERVLTNGT